MSARIYKQMARRAGLSAEAIDRISGHSTRVGAAQDMLRYGEQLPAIMQTGRWKTTFMVARYITKCNSRSHLLSQHRLGNIRSQQSICCQGSYRQLLATRPRCFLPLH
jgi:hypothetical protein